MEDHERSDLNKQKRRVHPKEQANLLSKLFFCWQLPIFLEGLKKDLTEENLYAVLKENESKRLGDKLVQVWEREENSRQNPSLWRALIKVFGLEFITCGIIYFPFKLLLTICQPLLLEKFLHYFSPQQTDITRQDAYLYSSLMLLLSFFHVLVFHSITFRLTALGMKIRVACCSLIYRKSLKLNKGNFGQATTGQIINLLSNDVNRFDEAFQYLHFLWITVIEIIAVTYLLDVKYGHEAITGVAVIIVALLSQLSLSKVISIYRMKIALKSDHRIHLMKEILSVIQVIKMYTWEKAFTKLAEVARRLELEEITKGIRFFTFNASFNVFLNKLTLFVFMLVAILNGLSLSAESIFVVVLFYESLKLSVTWYKTRGLRAIADASISVLRIQNFLMYENQNSQKESKVLMISNTKLLDKLIGVYAKDVTVKWDSTVPNCTLIEVNFNLSPRELVAFVGAAGSGKSTILQTILKEIPLLQGTLNVSGTVSYASQEPWIFSSSIKQNILFGEEMNYAKYCRVIRVCALEHDLSLFPFGDRTIVGEKGVMLSGGQKARINLARAIYRDADVYLLDDPLSAVDTHVAKQLFDDCILDYLRNKSTLLVTHQVQYLNKVQKIYVLGKGRIVASGTYKELNKLKNEHFRELTELVPENEKSDLTVTTKIILPKGTDMPVEFKELSVGTNSRNMYKNYITASGSCIYSFRLFSLFLIVQLFASGTDYLVTFWINLEQDRDRDHLAISMYHNKSGIVIDISDQDLKKFFTIDVFLYIYGTLVTVTSVLAIFRCWIFTDFCILISKHLHSNMFTKIIHGPMRFSNINPSGRILNRFSKDLGAVDGLLPPALFITLQTFLSLIAITVMVCILNFWILIPTIILFPIIYCYAVVFICTIRNIKRTEGTTRSPVFSHLAASLQGLITIRAFNAQQILELEFDKHQDVHTSVYYIYVALYATLGFWMDITSAIYMGFVMFSFFLVENGTYVGNIGLAITQSTILTGMLPTGMTCWSDADAHLTSVERIMEYAELTQENDDATDKPPDPWPNAGDIEFRSVCLQYSSDDPFVLNDISFKIRNGEKIGIVGRTGSGKSSLISVLFRLFHFEGTVVINNVDTKTIPLSDLRSKISIIPQEPALFSGTLRKNLDPFDEYSDLELWNALADVKLKETIAELPSGLESIVLEGGSNFSVGQKQLLCLVRAIIRKNKILVLDEATANIDLKTDELIQATISKKFKNCTILTIAHRLHTVMDSDKILVMDYGYAREFDHPFLLLQNPDGIFYDYVHKNGRETAENLMRISEDNFNRENYYYE